MPIDYGKAGRQAAKLVKTAGALRAAAPKPGRKPTAAQKKKLAALQQDIRATQQEFAAAVGVGARGATKNEVPATFDAFFSGVASSFAKAQRNLDDRTKEYLAGIQGRNELTPTAFRMSKVSADMKFAVDTVSETSVGVIFFKDTDTRHVQNEQTVHFELVAAPVPPGTAIAAPALPLLFSAAARQAAFAVVVKASQTAGDPAGASNLLAKPERVLMAPIDSARVLYLAVADATRFGIWRLDLQTETVTVLRPFGPAAAALEPVRATIFELGTQQAALLQTIG